MLGAVLSVGGASSATAAQGAPGRPVDGDCHTLTAAEAPDLSDTDPVVDCSTKHTSRTFWVGDLPDGVDYSDKDAAGEEVSKQCGPAWRKAVGGNPRTRYLTTLGYLWFQPTRAQIADGARWFRCDIVLWSGAKLAPLPTDREPVITSRAVPNSVTKCHLGQRQKFAETLCTKSHAYRAEGTFTMSGKKYPGERARMNAASEKCPRIAGTQDWLVFFPGVDRWNAGFKLFLCDAKTKR